MVIEDGSAVTRLTTMLGFIRTLVGITASNIRITVTVFLYAFCIMIDHNRARSFFLSISRSFYPSAKEETHHSYQHSRIEP